MKRNRELLAFEAQFEAEEFDIEAITASTGWSADRLGRAEYYTAGVDLLSWRSLADNETHTGHWRLSCKADKDYYRLLQQAAPPDTTIRVRVRRNRMSLLAVSLPQATGPRTVAGAITQTEPLCFRDPTLGAFLLEELPGFYRSTFLWCGCPVPFLFAESTAAMMAKSMDTVHALALEPKAWDSLMRSFTASRLLVLASKMSVSTDEPPPTPTALAARLTLQSVETTSRGRFTFCFDDGGLLGGTAVMVDGNLTDGPHRVRLPEPPAQQNAPTP